MQTVLTLDQTPHCLASDLSSLRVNVPFKESIFLCWKNIDIGTALCKNTIGHRRPRSACASSQSEQGLHCLQTESLNTLERISGMFLYSYNHLFIIYVFIYLISILWLSA